jgi:apolipoprotein N-acyltransferase
MRRLAWTSWVVLFVWWLGMARWLIPVTGPGWAGMAAVLALYWTGATVVLHWLQRRYEAVLALTLPLAWLSFELLRGHWPAGGFNWFMLGHALAPSEPGEGAGRFVQVADLFGVHGVSFLCAMVGGLIADVLTRPLIARSRRGWRQLRRSIRWAAGLAVVLLVAAWGYGQWRISQGAGVGGLDLSGGSEAGLAVAVVQSNVPQSNKNLPTRETDRQTWEQLTRLARRAARQQPKPDLIAWPETMVPAAINAQAAAEFRYRAERWADRSAEQLKQSPQASQLQAMAERYGVSLNELPGYMAQWYREKASYRSRLVKLARAVDTPLLVGSPTDYAGPDRDRRHNSIYLVRPDARAPLPRYDKLHLVPFGEYVPWVGLVPGLKNWFFQYLTPYGFDYTLDRGASVEVFEVQPRGRLHRPAKQPVGQSEPARQKAEQGRPAKQGTEAPQPAGSTTRDNPPATQTRASPQSVGVATPICFEDADPLLCRRMVYGHSPSKRAEVLVNITNDGWFAGSAQPWQHLQIATLRSIENRVPMARAVNTGVSGFVDSLGRVRQVVREDGQATQTPGVAVRRLRLDDRRTAYSRWGQWPIGLLAGVTAVLVLGGLARPDKLGRSVEPGH